MIKSIDVKMIPLTAVSDDADPVKILRSSGEFTIEMKGICDQKFAEKLAHLIDSENKSKKFKPAAKLPE